MGKLLRIQLVWLALLLMGASTHVYGQIEVYTTSATAETGNTVEVDVGVVNFTNLVNAQFSLNFDSLVAGFVEIGNYGLGNLTQDNFGTPLPPDPITNGQISFLWIAEDILSGESLPDSTVLFTVTFNLIGDPGDTTQVTITDDPTEIEFGNANGVVLDPILFSGTIEIEGGMSTQTVDNHAFRFHSLSPNPVQENQTAWLEFQLKRADDIKIRIFDVTGQVVYESQQHLIAGDHRYPITQKHFPTAGTYWVQMTVDQFQTTQPIIVVR